MTREDTIKLIRVITSTYPNWKPQNMTDTIDAWTWALEEYPFEAIQVAYKIYIRTDTSGFAPSVNQLITNLQKGNKIETMSDGEAWAMVKKAIQNGNYGSEEEFAKLPPIVQKAVGDANMIRQWAMSETSEVNTVIASNFRKTYNTLVDRESQRTSISPELMDLSRQIADKLAYKTDVAGIGIEKKGD